MIPSQISDSKRNLIQLPQSNDAIGEDLIIDDSMGLETNIYQQVQNSIDSIPRDSYFQHEQVQSLQNGAFTIEGQDTLEIQTLSIVKTPSTISPNAKTPKLRGKPKGSKNKTKIAVGIHTTFDSSFAITKRSRRRT